ncbi:phospholipase [Metarhizobium album]|uniref:Phospholipase n=1 Tax=Metarhizobium album TaxID=2182425 RepID=A0A2U2DT16_9HYPH|nr:phospholipase [Rhizobium album]PWE56466.1 phospholipase [Rhizobium album]
MSTTHFRILARILALTALFAGFLSPAVAGAETLQPFKDDLFSGQTVLESRDDGDFQRIDYQKMRDIYERDQIPEQRVKRRFVDLGIKKYQANETLGLGGRKLDLFRAGAARNAAFTVIFIHGRGGDRRLGANDYRFGGNFNRLKNLAVKNGGVYYAPSVRSFDAAGVSDVAGLIRYAVTQSPGRPVILTCASMGSFICWGVTRETEASLLSSMVILGGTTDPDFTQSVFHKAKLPIAFFHGSEDSVYAATDQIAFYDRLHKAGYPARFTLFETGSHGTPIRMVDWRAVLNWLLAGR